MPALLSSTLITARALPLHFLLCPSMRTDWLAKAAALPGRTLHYALAILVIASKANSPTVTPNETTLAKYGISRDAAGDALTRLAEAGMIRTDRRRGRKPTIVLLETDGRKLVLTQSVTYMVNARKGRQAGDQ